MCRTTRTTRPPATCGTAARHRRARCLIRLRTPGYGYALLESLNGLGITVDANTLYPLLRRLEKQGLLTSEWNTDEARPRKFYRTSPAGEELAGVLTADWKNIDRALARLTSETNDDRTDAHLTD